MSNAAYVYQVYDVDGRLIYVGCTRNVIARMRQHVIDSWWIDQAVKVQATVHPLLTVARRVERERIRELRPRWNIVGVPDRWTWTREQYHDYVLARINGTNRFFAESSHLRSMQTEYRYRFGAELVVPARTAAA